MVTRRVRPGGSVARIALFGALALAVLFSAVELDAFTATTHASDYQHSVILSRDTKSSIVAANSTRTRGMAWVASLVSSVGCAALAAQLIGAKRRGRAQRNLQRFSIRLRAPPHLLVAY